MQLSKYYKLNCHKFALYIVVAVYTNLHLWHFEYIYIHWKGCCVMSTNLKYFFYCDKTLWAMVKMVLVVNLKYKMVNNVSKLPHSNKTYLYKKLNTIKPKIANQPNKFQHSPSWHTMLDPCSYKVKWWTWHGSNASPPFCASWLNMGSMKVI